MKITDYADSINVNIIITYYHNQDLRFYACLEGAEVSRNGMLAGTGGNGKTPEAAVEEYVKEIRGKMIVFHATDEQRREFIVPYNLTGLN